ncbi:MAG: glycogen debranching enzyme N-terminal domain-containing protein [Chloroflexi bacterium]|nr:glycogen debranching enzyme N-terminal domain-containing protein [Chloroflexota bacterium]
MMIIPREVCQRPEAALEREWLVTNGLGGYAAASILGANTRSHHGLLVAALHPPAGRMVLLSKVDEEVVVDGQTSPLATNEYEGGLHPEGYRFLDQVRLEGMRPVFRYTLPGAVIEKTVWMEYGRHTTYILYHCLQAGAPVDLRLTPLVTFRDSHRETQGFAHWHFSQRPVHDGIEIEAYPGAPAFRLLLEPPTAFQSEGAWYWHFRHRWEERRGLPTREDVYRPGSWWVRMRAGDRIALIATAEPLEAVDRDYERALERYQERQEALLRQSGLPLDHDPLARWLVLAANQFLVSPPGAAASQDVGYGILAGYPWFGDRTRDTLVSLPGIALATGHEQAAAAILRACARAVDRGMLPDSLLDPARQRDFGGADTALWLFSALGAYLERTGDRALLREVYPALEDILRAYVGSARRRISMDPADSLLRVGEPGMTWMDARVGGWAVAPRTGKPVELNALWYHAVRSLAAWGPQVGRPIAGLDRLAERIRESFNRRFWYAQGGHLYDVVDGPEGNDASLRPNQVLAIALDHPVLEQARWQPTLEAVTGHLLTPAGLRTLSPFDPRYRGRYEGDQGSRDTAAYQGSAWPWLLGCYADAHRKTYGDPAATRRLFEGLVPHLAQGAIGTVGELFDGDLPQHPGGAVAQAWSVGEVLRGWLAAAYPPEQHEDP